ncbi:insulinase family protein [Methylobacterium sp. E-025]|uniref:M16 family metallopeptidase n=1 Tax=Methylobacterium sp. E-025 TaxID=2836561 RepID=UPI001FB9BF1B|nr:pitrilysin family protein [Methylobacterium sp. E-025]MCJ2111874.1 insulinase family protein [Methylobacterium sp. E-025]
MIPSTGPHRVDPVLDPGGAASPGLSVTGTRLANGLQVVAIPDRRSPIVTHMVWYRNGAADDPPGKSGIAHFLEHLMFKGTRTHPAGHFTQVLAALGGQENAFTAYDFTCYFQRVPAEHLALCMTYEADRMRNLVLTDEAVASERDVVLAERGMICDSDPGALLHEAVATAAFPAHPYGRPVIGWRHEIEGLGRADALAYYERFYTPSNAILVVAGNAEPERVHAMAEAAYGAIPAAGAAPERRRVQDPPARAQRRITLADAKVRQPHMARVFAVPSYGTGRPGEAEAFEVLAVLLGHGPTSVLHTRLVVGRRCATAIGAGYSGAHMLEQAQLSISGVPASGTTPEALDEAVEEILSALAESGFAAEDVVRAKRHLVAAALYERDSQSSLAQWYGTLLACGLDLEAIGAWVSRVEAVTPEALRAALLTLDRRTGVSGYLRDDAAAARLPREAIP